MQPYYQEDRITIYNGDCLDVLRKIGDATPPGGFDLAFFDPPYNCGKDYGTSQDNRSPEDYLSWAVDLCAQTQLLLGDSGDFAVVVPNRAPGVWMNSLVPGWPVAMKIRAGNAIRRNWGNKLCLLWTSIEPDKRQPNVWEDLRFKGEGYFFREHHYDHPGYTPECLTRRVLSLRQFTSAIDPCCGTGTTLRVAKALGMSAVGIEIDERWCEIAAKSLSQTSLMFA